MKVNNLTLALAAAVVVMQSVTADAQYLADRLVPPQSVPIPALPMTTQPATSRVFGADIVRPHLWSLPYGAFPGAPVALATEQQQANWKRPVLDVPSLASEVDPTGPTTPRQPVAMRAYVSSADPTRPPQLARFPLPNEPLVRADEDPSAASVFTLLTTPVALATPTSAPLLRLSTSDPFEYLRIIRLANPPADSDDPVATQDRPPLGKLPMVEAPK